MVRKVRYVHDDRVTFYGYLHDAHAVLEAHFERTFTTQFGISGAFHETLLLLARSPDLRLKVTELGGHLEITTGGATRLVNRVVAAGLARKEQSSEDRRVQWVVLTDEGRDIVERATRSHIVDLDHYFIDRMTEEEAQVLLRVLRRLSTRD